MNAINQSSGKRDRAPDAAPALATFHRVAEPRSETRRYIGLDRNERVSPLPDWFMDIIRESVTSNLLTWYPVQDELEHELSDALGLPQERILLTPSSDSAFKALYQAYIRPGDGIVMLDPSYAMFTVYSQMFEGKAIPITFNRRVELDEEELLNSVVPGVRLVMIANPNQPTGTLLGKEVLLELFRRAAAVGALVAMDEAYYPFTRATALPWVETYPNLLVIRTFSKAAGLAGLRIGFVAGHPDVIANLYKVRTVNDLNGMSVFCARQILKHPEVIEDYVAEVEAGGRLLAAAVQELGLTPLPTHANFMLLRVGDRCQPADLVKALIGHGYLVKGPLDAPCIDDCIRVTLGPPELMSDFVRCLGEVLNSEL